MPLDVLDALTLQVCRFCRQFLGCTAPHSAANAAEQCAAHTVLMSADLRIRKRDHGPQQVGRWASGAMPTCLHTSMAILSRAQVIYPMALLLTAKAMNRAKA